MKISCFLWVKVQNPKIFHLKSHKNKKSNKTSHLETENSFLLMIAALILISWRQKQFKRWKLKFLSTKNSVSDVTFTACRRSLPAPEDVRSQFEEKTFNMLRDNKLCRAQQRKHFLSGEHIQPRLCVFSSWLSWNSSVNTKREHSYLSDNGLC